MVDCDGDGDGDGGGSGSSTVLIRTSARLTNTMAAEPSVQWRPGLSLSHE